MSKGIFIVGTGTDVGKTYVTALIVKKMRYHGYHAGYFKAAVSGNEYQDGILVPGDAAFVSQFAGVDAEPSAMCPYLYKNAFSPHLAAQLEGNPVSMDVVKQYYADMCSRYEYVAVEGSGGILCPIRYDREKIWLEDIIREFGLECILVADAGLGTINNALLTIFYMRQHGIGIRGIIMNRYIPGDVMHEDNINMVTRESGVPVLAVVKQGDAVLDMDIAALAGCFS